MVDNENVHTGSMKNKLRNLEDKTYKTRLQQYTVRLKEIEVEIKSLYIRVPDKERYIAEKNNFTQTLNDVRLEREKHFADKRLVDAELKSVNHDIQTKHDSIGKLKSILKYKTQERVDQVIVKLEKQLPKLKTKPSEQRRIEQEISELRGSKDKIIDYRRLETEVQTLREKQQDLRNNKDKNIQQITAIKQKENATKTMLEDHKQAVDEVWMTYKDNLSKRDQLRNEKDELIRNKRELTERYKNKQLKNRKDQERGKHETDEQTVGNSVPRTKTIRERKKPFETNIHTCEVLLSFLNKYTAQHSTAVTEDQKDKPSFETSDFFDNVDGKVSTPITKDIYRGIKRRPSKKERRRKQHPSEMSKKIDLHVTVLEQLVSLGIQPPSTLADLATAIAKLQEKKKSFEEDQLRMLKQIDLRRARSIPSLGLDSTLQYSELSKFDQSQAREDISQCDLYDRKKGLSLGLTKRHKSCPSLLSGTAEKHFSDIESPCSSITKEFSSNNSECDLDSPVSGTSSASFVDKDSKSDFNDYKHDVDFSMHNVESEENRTFHVSNKAAKSQHKVHFSTEILELVSPIENHENNVVSNSESIAVNALDADVRQESLGSNNVEKNGVLNNRDSEQFDMDVKLISNMGLEEDDAKRLIKKTNILSDEKSILEFNPKNIDRGFKENDDFEEKLLLETQRAIPSEIAVDMKTMNIGNSHVNLEYDGSARQNEDAFLQFEMDDISQPISQTEMLHKNYNNEHARSSGMRITDAFQIPNCASRLSCSPRKSNQDYLSMDQSSDEGVEVKT